MPLCPARHHAPGPRLQAGDPRDRRTRRLAWRSMTETRPPRRVNPARRSGKDRSAGTQVIPGQRSMSPAPGRRCHGQRPLLGHTEAAHLRKTPPHTGRLQPSTTRSVDPRPSRPERAWTGHGPSPVTCGGYKEVSMIRSMRGMTLAVSEMCDRVQAGRVHKFAKSESRTPEPGTCTWDRSFLTLRRCLRRDPMRSVNELAELPRA